MKKLKQILSNKNTVTLIAAILIVLVLYFFYNWRLDQAIDPVRVPYALQTIEPRTKITEDMIGYLEISQGAIKGNIVTNADYLINNKTDMYTNVNSSIPQGSLFYKAQVIPEEELPDSFLILSTISGSVKFTTYFFFLNLYFWGVSNKKSIDLPFRV